MKISKCSCYWHVYLPNKACSRLFSYEPVQHLLSITRNFFHITVSDPLYLKDAHPPLQFRTTQSNGKMPPGQLRFLLRKFDEIIYIMIPVFFLITSPLIKNLKPFTIHRSYHELEVVCSYSTNFRQRSGRRLYSQVLQRRVQLRHQNNIAWDLSDIRVNSFRIGLTRSLSIRPYPKKIQLQLSQGTMD